jgi:tetratricopeptide (TPR) repeat protein
MAAPTISLVMIVRDEESFIEQSLKQAAKLVDEIIVVDTGSKDNTKKIAEKYKGKIFDFAWSDDFSKARNFSLSKASCDWILVLDADEIIDDGQYGYIHKLIQNPHAAYLLTQRHYTNDQRLSGFIPVSKEYPLWEKSYAGYFESALCRLFPNHQNLEYRGNIHELVEMSVTEKKHLTLLKSDVILHHYGHTPQVREKKNKSALYSPLGEDKAKEQPKEWKAWYELGVELNISGKLKESAEALETSANLKGDYLPTLINLGYVLCEIGQYEKARSVLKEALKLDPRSSEAHCNFGVVELRQNTLPAAIRHFRAATLLNPKYINAYCNLAKALAKSGAITNAALIYLKALSIMPECQTAKNDLEELYRIVKDTNA